MSFSPLPPPKKRHLVNDLTRETGFDLIRGARFVDDGSTVSRVEARDCELSALLVEHSKIVPTLLRTCHDRVGLVLNAVRKSLFEAFVCPALRKRSVGGRAFLTSWFFERYVLGGGFVSPRVHI
jgi:hypothetical protein